MPLTRTSGSAGGSISPIMACGNNRLKIDVGTIAFDNSYATNGLAITFGGKFKKILGVFIQTSGGYTFEYVPTSGKPSGKVKAYSAGTQVSNATDLSALTAVPYIAIGY